MSVTNPEDAKRFFSHFPEPGSLTWPELLAVSELPDEPGAYFRSDRHATREVFGDRTPTPPETPTHYVGQTAIEAA